MQKLRSRVRKEGWKGRLVTFLHDLESGKFDPDLNEPEPESKGAKEAANPDAKESNGAEEAKNPGDDDMSFAVDAEDDNLDNDRARGDPNGRDSRRGNGDRDRGEEVAAPMEGNQVMIRTIPPDIGRLKLEEVGAPSRTVRVFSLILTFRRVVNFPDMYTSHSAIQCRNGITTVLAGFASMKMQIWVPLCLNYRRRRFVFLVVSISFVT